MVRKRKASQKETLIWICKPFSSEKYVYMIRKNDGLYISPSLFQENILLFYPIVIRLLYLQVGIRYLLSYFGVKKVTENVADFFM